MPSGCTHSAGRPNIRQSGLPGLLFALALLFCGPVHATPITYSVNNSLGFNSAVGAARLTGTITTDGTLGPLAISDIQAWNLLVTIGSLSAPIVSGNSFVTDLPIAPPCSPCSHAPLSATATQLIYDFSPCGIPTDPCLLNFQNFATNDFVVLIGGSDGIIVGAIDLHTTPQSIATSNVFPLSGPYVLASVPEPGTVSVFAILLLGLFLSRRRRALPKNNIV